jgi:hypothetical protein
MTDEFVSNWHYGDRIRMIVRKAGRSVMSGIIKIENEIPFGHSLYRRLSLLNLHLDKLVQHDKIEKHYLAWETVRKQTNPFFQIGTGFEGYLVSRCEDPEAALDEILAISQDVLDAITRFYRYQYRLRSQLMKTLTRDSDNAQAIAIWSAYFGAELGKLRAQILGDAKSQAFRAQTYKIVDTLPQIVYHETEKDITQTYAVGSVGENKTGKLYVTSALLQPAQQDAWLVAENIGEFGHPLVRKLLARSWQPIPHI